ncbi:18S rRNA maturation protein [Coemansia sp. RSA 1813]|nr:18S rRNA maturation protein [Coemansia sp. RSA 1646]KAJ1767562.1 18S rRNA maturation protein [Coemansia sp. RSA 1843]KAJ2086295.1 18S rRNA maturation protein [Coemansia sp. RSA 986]KAJ2211364.1 18S rRNA maturation protein [Coemansia sp. RSA 487]KAJ2564702.1 18S rRNA maturation protein [Coemansia sp. RSA 1813]
MPKLERNSQQQQKQQRQNGPYRETKPYDQKHRQHKKGGKNSKRGNKWDNEELPTSVSACNKQLRDINRLLSKDTGLPSTKKVEFARRAKALNILKEQLTNTRSNKANATRYHGIKFFERKKVLRKLAQAEKKQQQGESSDEEKNIQELLVNLNYTTYYPDEIKYISLYPADLSKTPPEVLEKQNLIRNAIRLAMEKHDLPKDPRLVSVEDRKAVRKNNRTLLRTVSSVHGHDNTGADSGDSSATDQDEGNESGKNDSQVEDDFFE